MYRNVHNKLKSPGAMKQIVRLELAKLFIDFPIQLSLMLLFTAGITGGLYVPFTPDEMFGDNSIVYMSRYSLYGGFLLWQLLGMFSRPWGKLQENSRHRDEGRLGRVPEGKDAEKKLLQVVLEANFPKRQFSFKQLEKLVSDCLEWNACQLDVRTDCDVCCKRLC